MSSTMTFVNLTLATISIERRRAVIHPLRLPLKESILNIIIAINFGATVAVSSFIAIIYHAEDKQPYYCMESNDTVLYALTAFFYTSVANIIPLGIIIVCYTWIAVKLCASRLPVDSMPYRQQMTIVIMRKKTKIVTILVITIISMATSTHYLSLYVYVTFSKVFKEDIDFNFHNSFWNYYRISWMVTLSTCIINPLLYNFCSESFNHTLRCLIKP